jgi:DNA-binding response OmpR family regulator
MVSWILEDMLADLGCQVVGPAARVQQAISIIEVEPVDLAVLDINLNGEKSYPVADALRDAASHLCSRAATIRTTCPLTS